MSEFHTINRFAMMFQGSGKMPPLGSQNILRPSRGPVVTISPGSVPCHGFREVQHESTVVNDFLVGRCRRRHVVRVLTSSPSTDLSSTTRMCFTTHRSGRPADRRQRSTSIRLLLSRRSR